MIAVLSDVHGNLPALKAVLCEVDRLGCDRLISLGDVTGYYAEPGKCIDLLVQRDAVQLRGNHDEYLIAGTGCPRSKMITALLKHQRSAVTNEQLAYLSTLKSHYDEGDNSFVHGGWDNELDQYLYTVTPASLPDGSKRFFSGHTHVQTLAELGGKVFCNPGSVGQPRDGDARAAFATLDGEKIQLHRVEYDIDAAAQAMKDAGFVDEKLWMNLYIGAQIGGRIDQITIEQ